MTELVRGHMIGRSLRLLEPLGAGGMGSVWVAEHIGLRTHVAVKFIARERAADTESNARFAREAAAASSVKSPHVVQMLDYGVTEDGIAYIVMELLEGRDLARRIREHGPLGTEEVLPIVEQAAVALDRAHARNVVHRDIKPENIFLCDVGGDTPFVKILDFGVAKESRNAFGTMAGELLGTPAYMSPEQLEGATTVGSRSDLWSLGVVVFEALTGHHAFDGANLAEIVTRIHIGPLPRPSELVPSLPASVDEWFFRACARDPQGRFASGREMARALGLALRGEAIAPSSTPSPAFSNVRSQSLGRTQATVVPMQRASVAWFALAIAAFNLLLVLALVLFPTTKRSSSAPQPASSVPAIGGGAPATSEEENVNLPVPLPAPSPSAVPDTGDAGVPETTARKVAMPPRTKASATTTMTTRDAEVADVIDSEPKNDASEDGASDAAPDAEDAANAPLEQKQTSTADAMDGELPD